MSLAAGEASFFKNVLKNMDPHATSPFILYSDNQAANSIARGTGSSSRARHIDLTSSWRVL
jgi:hypothetical protein